MIPSRKIHILKVQLFQEGHKIKVMSNVLENLNFNNFLQIEGFSQLQKYEWLQLLPQKHINLTKE
jgi:hypothetical protein